MFFDKYPFETEFIRKMSTFCGVVGSFNTGMKTELTIIFFSILFCFSFLSLFYSSVFSSYFFLFLSSSLDLHMWVYTVCNKAVPDIGSCQYNIRNALLMLAYVELLGTSRSSCKFRNWGGEEIAFPTHACGCAIYRSETTTCISGGGDLLHTS